MEEQSEQSDILKKREYNFLKSNWIFVIVLIGLMIFGWQMRTLPMADHGDGHPGLWDITKNTWTLGPDLDPFLFLRYAKIIEANGSLPEIDMTRYVPLGYDTGGETTLLPKMIVWIHHGLEHFGMTNNSLEYAAVIFPVIMFMFLILFFFLFVREIFIKNSDDSWTFKANLIATISTLFMIISPSFVARTVAGIPEKESAGFVFMFLAFYLFLKAWKYEGKYERYISAILALLAGIATGLMGLVWGGVVYLFVTISVSMLLAIILNKIGEKEKYSDIYILWFFSALAIMFLMTERFSLVGFITSIDTGLAFFVLGIIFMYWIIKVVYQKIGRQYPNKIPLNILAIPLIAVVGLLSVIGFLGLKWAWLKILDINRILFNPAAGGRWVTTVAENAQPYFVQWFGNFGMWAFMLIIVGAVFLFIEALKYIKKKDLYYLSGLFLLSIFGLACSRYAPNNTFNGTNPISKAFFVIPALIFVGYLVYSYIKYHKEGNYSYDKAPFEYLLLIVLFILAIFTARSAFRLVMVVTVVAPIFIGYLIINCYNRYKAATDSTKKIIIICGLILILFIAAYSGQAYYNSAKGVAYGSVPYYYTYQWQIAMDWVRDNTPTNAVFVHWWDYGYWVQSIGERATVTDGANSNTWWNYLTGRHLLTGDNQQRALDFCYAHNVSYFLIDSSDISKYGAYSQIGSDENYDRLSYGPITIVSDPKTIQELKNYTIRTYSAGGSAWVDENIHYNNIYLFHENSGFLGALVASNNDGSFQQPQGVFVTTTGQVNIPLRYIYYNDEIIDFGSGINATIKIIDRYNNGIKDPMGAAVYISPRIMKTFFGQVYLLNDPFNNFPQFELVHSEPDFILNYLNQYGAGLGEFTEHGGIKGPIKIWKVNYTGNEIIHEEDLLRSAPDYITWMF